MSSMRNGRKYRKLTYLRYRNRLVNLKNYLFDRRNDSELIKDRKVKKSYLQELHRSTLTLIRFAMPCNDFRIFSRERFQHAIPRFATSLIFSFPLENIFTIFLRT